MIQIIDGVAYRVSPNGKTLTRLELEYVEENKEKLLALYTTDELMAEITRRLERD